MGIRGSEITSEMVNGMVNEFLENQQYIQLLRQQIPKRVQNMVPGFDDFVVTERIPGNQENRSYSQITSSL